jgi:hypothetical protein
LIYAPPSHISVTSSFINDVSVFFYLFIYFIFLFIYLFFIYFLFIFYLFFIYFLFIFFILFILFFLFIYFFIYNYEIYSCQAVFIFFEGPLKNCLVSVFPFKYSYFSIIILSPFGAFFGNSLRSSLTLVSSVWLKRHTLNNILKSWVDQLCL